MKTWTESDNNDMNGEENTVLETLHIINGLGDQDGEQERNGKDGSYVFGWSDWESLTT